MHKLLARQLRRFVGSEAGVSEALAPLVAAVDEAYRQADSERELLEHSIDTVSEELVARYELLQQALTESQRTEEDLRSVLSLVEATLEATADGVLVVDTEGRIVRTNDRFAELWGIPDEVLAERDDERAIAWVADQLENPDEFRARIRDLYASPEADSFDTIRFKDERVIERFSQPQRIEGRTVGRVWSFRDITERRLLEEQLWQTQKMQAVGGLAGGIAHDFNNLLTVIQVHADELQEDRTLTGERRENAEEIIGAAARAAELTRQLLAFSRKQILRPVALDLNDVVREIEPLLRRLIGRDVRIRTDLSERIGAVKADRSQLGQVLINLAVNARDAMPGGGRLRIHTSRVDHPSARSADHDIMAPGPYAVLAVSDTGHGVPLEARDRMFEPFFTTKEVGKGTGLGLATVYGIVKQSGGFIWLEDDPSAPAGSVGASPDRADGEGPGATFSVYLPLTDEAPVATARRQAADPSTRGTETVLVAEGEPAVRRLVERLLERHGYEVLAARSGRHAASLAEAHEGPIDLVLTDLAMPGLNGHELVALIRERWPATPALFMSGVTDDERSRRGVAAEGAPYIQKPFRESELLRTVREVLDG